MCKDIVNGRLIVAGIIISILFSTMILRLTYIQVLKHEDYNELAIRQRSTEIEIDSSRGYIFDKNLKPITNNTSTPMIIVPRNLINKDKNIYSRVLENTSLSFKELKKTIEEDSFLLQIPLKKHIDTSNYNNVIMIDSINRYDPDNTLSHVIGYVNKADNKGQSGLERVFDYNLTHSSKNKILIEHDDNKSFFIGATEEVDDTIKAMDPTSVVTTIDIDIQRQVEDIMDKHRVNGSVIVAEVDSGNISAMASRPNFKQDEIFNYSTLNDMSLYNKSIGVGYPPGSVFKIVVLLAALEENKQILNEEFNCSGHEYVDNLRIGCSAVHNNLNLKEAFSKSCNSTFVQIGKKIGSEKILDMARKLNFGEKINIGLMEERPGTLPSNEESAGPAVGHISIGQWQIETTPLQITNLMMTIANNGVQKHLRLIQGESNDEGYIIKEYNVEKDKRVIVEEDAEILSQYLIEVVEKGTGRNINLHDYGSAGGKTGSAEAVLNGEETVHGWFSGFFPAYKPKYVITVLVENGISGSRSAAPIFEEISLILNKRR